MGFLFVCGDNFANLHFRVAEADGALLVLEVDGHLGTVVQATETTLTTIEEYGTLVANLDVVAGADFGAGAATDTVLVFDAECAGFHQLGNRQQLAAQLFGHIEAIARSGKIENLHNLILGDF